MVRALVIAAALTGAIVACSFQGQPLGGDGGNPSRDGGPGGDGRPGVDAKLADARLVDATTACDPTACGDVGGTCNNNVCEITASGNGVTCPPGESCTITCNNSPGCNGTIDCSQSTNCHIRCEGGQTCGGTVHCGAGSCTVDCDAGNTCDGMTLIGNSQCLRHCCAGNPGNVCNGGTITSCSSTLGGCT